MYEKRSKPAGISNTLLNYISIKPKISKINDPFKPQELFASPSTSDIVGHYEHFSSNDI